MEKNEDIQGAFFCVPDITGFTKFIATSDLSFSSDFIPGLLRRLISANIINMNVGEIEGDAIFFYKTGRLPSIHRVAKQCRLLFQTFHDYLKAVEKDDPENFARHLADGQMGLKIIIHYGEIMAANIKGRTKLIGQNVIIAHKLLKNKIQEGEYVLLTQDYINKLKVKDISPWFPWGDVKQGSETYEYLGEVKYSYIPFEINEVFSNVLMIDKKTS
ncbi:DUF2652 domain-containing protein [Paradesertivirga mongoliensis]|uniref:DUF2652 domain-containing protein n=1 Tax=Paradesertivirga mongoliensis TaxID=2100740 RepID=A0ABW4ZGB1_9SPHI|nr:DUF2652 domain-containing protein [Pedobacter mongoliensis]